MTMVQLWLTVWGLRCANPKSDNLGWRFSSKSMFELQQQTIKPEEIRSRVYDTFILMQSLLLDTGRKKPLSHIMPIPEMYYLYRPFFKCYL